MIHSGAQIGLLLIKKTTSTIVINVLFKKKTFWQITNNTKLILLTIVSV